MYADYFSAPLCNIFPGQHSTLITYIFYFEECSKNCPQDNGLKEIMQKYPAEYILC